MAHGHEPQPIPKVEFKIVDPSVLVAPDVQNSLAAAYGFNDGKEWTGGDSSIEGRYIRYLPPMEADLAKQVEYDMDEQDQIWLEAVNAERKAEGHAPVSCENFEIIFDKLEKEWFDLAKAIPKKPSPAMEESVCAICDDGECENSNAIVFCDGCNLAVHQDCYGVPYIPEGQWLCRKCTVSPDKPVSCVLCPNSYGAFKQTTTAQWAHLLCAIWVPDTGVSNTVYMEPIDGVENIGKSRWKLVCYLCRKRVGACIQCAKSNCYSAFHVTCAREHGLELRMKQQSAGGELKTYCEKHCEDPEGVKARRAIRVAASQSRLTQNGNSSILKSTKSNRAYKKSYSSGPPLVPSYVFDRVNQYVGKLKIVNKRDFMNLLCRYWSLKREARRGAPLLKRLHLEPWTASGTAHHQTEHEKAKKLELMRLVRNDLEKVRMLTEQVRKREKKKLERVLLFKNWIDDFIFPKDKRLREALGKVAALDKQQFFAQPVSRAQAPDYGDIIKHPMDWSTMGEKIDRHEYTTAFQFRADVELVLNNARLYNKKETVIHRHAVRLLTEAEDILSSLASLDDPNSDPAVLRAQLQELVTPEYLESLFDFSYDPPAKEPEKPVEAEVEKGPDLDDKDRGKSNGDEAGQEQEREDAMDVDGASDSEGGSEEGGEKKGGANAADLKTPATNKKKRARGAETTTTTRDGKRRKKDGSAPPAASGEDTAEQDPEDSVVRRGLSREMQALEAAGSTPLVSSRVNPREAARLRAEKDAEGDGKELSTSMSTSRSKSKSAEKDEGPRGRHAKDEKKLVVDDVDPRASFKLFETGWVLPEGSSRRRRSSTTEPLPITAPTPSTSRRGYAYEPIIESDPAEDAAKSNDGSSTEPAVAVKKVPAPVKNPAPAPTRESRSSKGKDKEVPAAEASEKCGRSARKSTAAARETVAPTSKPKSRASKVDKGEVQEAEATPSASKGKGKAVDQDEGAEKVEQTPANPALEPSTAPEASVVADVGPRSATTEADAAGPSAAAESTTTSDVEMKDVAEERPEVDDEKKDVKIKPADGPMRRKALLRKGADRQAFVEWATRVDALEDQVAVTEQTELFDGLLVWARTSGHWPFPAEIADPNHEDTPRALLEAKPAHAERDGLVPIMFFDDTRSGCWCARKDMRLLGECEEMDQLLRSYHTINTINKHAQKPLGEKAAEKRVADIEEAYDWAQSMIALPGEEGEAEAITLPTEGDSPAPATSKATGARPRKLTKQEQAEERNRKRREERAKLRDQEKEKRGKPT